MNNAMDYRTVKLLSSRQIGMIVGFILAIGFGGISIFSYRTSAEAIHKNLVEHYLPLTARSIYSELQKELDRPINVSKGMAHNAFLRGWMSGGEKDKNQIARYLKEIRVQNGAFSSFFVSDKTLNYYTSEGILKKLSSTSQLDTWYFRVRSLPDAYEINIDPDLAHADKLTIFVNYRTFDDHGHYIGATGMGVAADSVQRLIEDYQRKFHGKIFFVDQHGKVVKFGESGSGAQLSQLPGIGELSDQIIKNQYGNYQYVVDGNNYNLNVNFLPEIKWLLCVEQNETVALADNRHILYVNLAISFVVMSIILLLLYITHSLCLKRIEELEHR